MKFLQLSAETHQKYIVKLNVLRRTRDEFSDFQRFVFVFSQNIEDSSSYGKVVIELVPEREIPLFHENLKNVENHEVKDEQFVDSQVVPIDSKGKIKIIKDVGDFTTNYIAKIICDESEQTPHYHLLLTRNRGLKGKLENAPSAAFAQKFQIAVCDYKASLEKQDLEKSVARIQQLGDSVGTREEIIHELNQQKLQVETRSVSDCLRSFYQDD